MIIKVTYEIEINEDYYDKLNKNEIRRTVKDIENNGNIKKLLTDESLKELYEGEKNKEIKLCNADGCDEPQTAKGFCSKHYARLKRLGTTELASSVCSVEGCERIASTRGYCRKHYKRVVKTGTPFIKPKYNKTCSAAGCERDAKTKGYCQKHYMKFLKYGDPLYTVRKTNKGKTCSVEGCLKEASRNELCPNHYSNFLYYKRKQKVSSKEEYVEFKNNQ